MIVCEDKSDVTIMQKQVEDDRTNLFLHGKYELFVIFERTMMKLLRLTLFPVTIVYAVVVYVRNLLFDAGIFKSRLFPIPIISVGNLEVGGSGKTPVTEYLVNLLNERKIAILSRGYGRSTKGFIIGGEDDTAETIGDEPMQYRQKFPNVTVAVCEDRVKGIENLIHDHDLILLDDAFQHRWVKPGLNVLLFDYNKLPNRLLLPAGNLREPFHNYHRADIILITKIPKEIQGNYLETASANFDKSKPVYFSGIRYGDLRRISNHSGINIVNGTITKVILVTGIANSQPLVAHLENLFNLVKHFNYRDHYQFTEMDIKTIAAAYSKLCDEKAIIITTEKDAQRLFTGRFHKLLINLPIYTIPIQIEIHPEGKMAFDKTIKDYVASATRNH